MPQPAAAHALLLLPVGSPALLTSCAPPPCCHSPLRQYKENCGLVIIDWFLRHGYLTPDMPGYLALLRGLRAGDCS